MHSLYFKKLIWSLFGCTCPNAVRYPSLNTATLAEANNAVCMFELFEYGKK